MCFVTPQTMQRIVQGMLRKGWIERAAHPTHGRVLQTSLTPNGQRLIASCHGQVHAVEQAMLSRLTKAQRSHLQQLLKACAEGLTDG